MAVSKHVFISWMAILNRLPTMDRLASWGMQVRGVYYLCQEEMETRDHLFFGCNFSKAIWRHILHLCGLHREVGGWQEELRWAVTKIKGKALISIFLNIAWKACIYHVWRERNGRMHSKPSNSSLQIIEQIKEIICIKLNGVNRVATDDVNRMLCRNWGFTVDVFG